jgi:hypothetical protein
MFLGPLQHLLNVFFLLVIWQPKVRGAALHRSHKASQPEGFFPFSEEIADEVCPSLVFLRRALFFFPPLLFFFPPTVPFLDFLPILLDRGSDYFQTNDDFAETILQPLLLSFGPRAPDPTPVRNSLNARVFLHPCSFLLLRIRRVSEDRSFQRTNVKDIRGRADASDGFGELK